MTRARTCDPHTARLRCRVPHAAPDKSHEHDRARKAPAAAPHATTTTSPATTSKPRGRTRSAHKQPAKPRKLTVREIAANVKAAEIKAAPAPLRIVSKDAVLDKLVAAATPRAQPPSPVIQAFGRAFSAAQAFLIHLDDDAASRKHGAATAVALEPSKSLKSPSFRTRQGHAAPAVPAVALVAFVYVAVLAQSVH